MPFRKPTPPRKKTKRLERMSVEVRGFPQRLREERERMNLGVVELDNLAKVSAGTTTRIEKGLRSADIETLFRYAKALGLNIHWLVTGEGQRPASYAAPLALVGSKRK